jgi:hypothetical protein
MTQSHRDISAAGKVRTIRRRRHHTRPPVLQRLLYPVWCEFRTMLRTPLYRWSIATVASLALLFWLVGVLVPSSNPYLFRHSSPGQLTR